MSYNLCQKVKFSKKKGFICRKKGFIQSWKRKKRIQLRKKDFYYIKKGILHRQKKDLFFQKKGQKKRKKKDFYLPFKLELLYLDLQPPCKNLDEPNPFLCSFSAIFKKGWQLCCSSPCYVKLRFYKITLEKKENLKNCLFFDNDHEKN